MVAAALLQVSTLYIAHADSAASATLTVDQGEIFVTAEPGQRLDARLQLLYQGARPAELRWEVRDFETLPDGSLAFLPPVEGRPAPSEWIAIGTSSLQLHPGVRTALPIQVSPVPGTPPGEYAALLLLHVSHPAANGVELRPQLGVRIYSAIPGEVRRAGELGSLQVSSLLDLDPALIEVRLRNTGSVHLDASGNIRATPLGKGRLSVGASTSVDSPARTTYVLPGESRDLSLRWTPPGYGLYWLTYEPVDDDIVEGPGAWAVVLPWRLATATVAGLLGLALLLRPIKEPLRKRIIASLGGVDRPR